MSHAHEHPQSAPRDLGRAFAIGVALNVGFVVLEAGAGLWTHSLALLADDPARGVLNAVARAASAFGLDERGFLAGCVFFAHGSTVATNTLLEQVLRWQANGLPERAVVFYRALCSEFGTGVDAETLCFTLEDLR